MSCADIGIKLSEDSLLSHTGNTHTIVPVEALEYLSNHFSWLSWPLWEYGIIIYYQILWDMNNVQFLPVPCIISSEIVLFFFFSAAHFHAWEIKCISEKKKTTQNKKKEPLTKVTELFNNLP